MNNQTDSKPTQSHPKAEKEEWSIFRLKPNPLQETYFPEQSEADEVELAKDILANGLRMPPEVKPDGTLLSGHCRRRALLHLHAQGHKRFKTVQVLVRYDLAAQGEEALKKHFLFDNVNRRHLTPMAFAALSRELYRLQHGKDCDDASLRSRVAQLFNVSEKTLLRYWALLDLPLELQQLINTKQLTKELGQELLRYATPKEIEELRQLAIEGGNVKKPAKKLVVPRRKILNRKFVPKSVLRAFLNAATDVGYCYMDIGEFLATCDHGLKLRDFRFHLRRVMQVLPKLLDLVENLPQLANNKDSRSLEFDQRTWDEMVAQALARIAAADQRRWADDDEPVQPLQAGPTPPVELQTPSRPAKTLKLQLPPAKPPQPVLKKAPPPLVLKRDLPPIVLRRDPPPLALRKDPPPLVLKRDVPPLKLRKSPAA